ncbi:glucan 1-3-beta-glucosidase [Apiospora marii]|uniref:Glucan 1-3-beta-glucosidase n=1 Tax=Apiospora marii TaxID=335849 RepID=A0ABR1SBM4_9PEZI
MALGTQDGPVWQYSGSFDNFMKNLRAGHVIRGGDGSGLKPTHNTTLSLPNSKASHPNHSPRADSSSYWLTSLGPLGTQPHADPGYKFFRNVVDDYGADNSGNTDTTECINAAIQDGSRCGKDCGSTFTKGAIIYFPPGTYTICTPIIQLYYTQFIGDPNDPPTIKGCDTFKGIAMIDTDPYIPGTSGDQWFVNENQFFRHIRNFIFDLTDMPLSTTDNGQPYVPTGIHWQAAQATTLQNLVFNMPNATDVNSASHVGIFMENGSGGFVSDLVCQSKPSSRFSDSSILTQTGSQQYTARNIKFYGCLTSVQMVWDWGFNWQGVEIHGGAVGFNISGRGGDGGQDCAIFDVPTAILTNGLNDSPNIVLDNLFVDNVGAVVAQDDNRVLLNVGNGPYHIILWAAGQRYNGSEGSYQAAPADAPPKGQGLLENGNLFVRSRPQYEDLDPSNFLVATNEGISNDGSGDQAGAINAFLEKAATANQIAYFPAGIYQVGSTVLIPTGSRVQGSSWSQIQGAGVYFADMHNPKVMVQVGNKGDVGNIEIVEMLFTVAGPTAGAVLMEWNVAAAQQGSAAMWDSHFRVGGATGTDLDVEHCPKSGEVNGQCIAASLMFHVTQQASGYFENVWAWVADHDNDFNVVSLTDKTSNRVSVYGARGMLIESEGPSWFYGSGSEHSVLYNYQFSNAKNVYIGHLQTEAPYFQPEPVAPNPFLPGKSFAADPTFDGCTIYICRMSWGMRILDSTNITVHGAGLYSFFQNFQQNCTDMYNCQERILEVQNSQDVTIFNMFTLGTENVALGIDGTAIRQNDTQSGRTTEVSIWLPTNGQDTPNIVYVGPEIWATPNVSCPPPCILVLPISPLSTSSTIDPGNYTTSLEYAGPGTTTAPNGQVITTIIIATTIVTIDIPLLTIGGMPYYNLNITSTATGGGLLAEPSVDIPPVGVPLPDGKGGTTTRSVALPPWPKVSQGPPDGPGWTASSDPFAILPPTTSTSARPVTFFTPYSTFISVSGPTVTTIHLPPDLIPTTTVACPPVTELTFATPKTTFTLDPDLQATYTIGYECPRLQTYTFLDIFSGYWNLDCSFVTSFHWPTPTPTLDPNKDPLVLPPMAITFPGGLGRSTVHGIVYTGLRRRSISTPTVPATTSMTFIFGNTAGGAPPTTVSIGGAVGGQLPATLTIGGAPAPGGHPQSTAVTFGIPTFWQVPLPTTLTLGVGFLDTTLTLGGGYILGDIPVANLATTLTWNGVNGRGFDPTTFALEGGFFAGATTMTLVEPTTVTFTGGFWDWGLEPTPTPTKGGSTPSGPLPFWNFWPSGEIVAIRADDPTQSEDGTTDSDCHWFFVFKICSIKVNGININLSGFRLRLPPGIYPPGPPPLDHFKFPKLGTYKFKGKLPPWPKITIGWDHKLTYSDDRSTSCQTQTAELCTITTSVIVESGTTRRSTITGDCDTIEGCSALAHFDKHGQYVQRVQHIKYFKHIQHLEHLQHIFQQRLPAYSKWKHAYLDKGEVCFNDAIVFPTDPGNVGEIPDILANYTGKYKTVEALGYTGFYWVPGLDTLTYEALLQSPDVDGVSYYEQRNMNLPDEPKQEPSPEGPVLNYDLSDPGNSTTLRVPRNRSSPFWETGVDSLPKGQALCGQDSYSCERPRNPPWYKFWWDTEGGWDNDENDGWTVYVTGENGTWDNHVELRNARISNLINGMTLPHPLNGPNLEPHLSHGTGVVAHINGAYLGTCKKCRVIWTEDLDWQGYPAYVVRADLISELYMIYYSVHSNGGSLLNKAVVNMSWKYASPHPEPALLRSLKYIMDRLEAVGVVMVVSAGNSARENGKEPDAYPARFGSPSAAWNPVGQLKSLIVVGATDINGTEPEWGQSAAWITTYAPGEEVRIPIDPAIPGTNGRSYRVDNGTSYSAPQVAGIAAYLRSLPGPFHEPLKNPRNVKKMIAFLARRYTRFTDAGVLVPVPDDQKRPVAWNGQVQVWNETQQKAISYNCLKDWDTREDWDANGACDGLDPDMRNMGPGESVLSCGGPPPRNRRNRRTQNDDGDDAGSCPVDPIDPGVQYITFASASVAQPTCSAAGGCGGTVCSGYYCGASPTGTPPDHQDPQDPENGQPVPSSTVTRSWSTEPATPTELTTWYPTTAATTTSSTSTVPSITPSTTTTAPSPTPTCDDQCKLDNGYPCTCNEDGCDDSSPACCSDASCPDCYCSDTGCDASSPKCCATDSCAWSWTGGGGGDKAAAISRQLRDRLAAVANSSTAVYGLRSHTNTSSGSWHLAGYNGRLNPASVCTEAATWSLALNAGDRPSSGLQTWYAELTAFNDTCSYLAAVNNYTSVAAGAKVGALACRRWATADCYRANHTDVHDCGTDKVAEELVCQW